MSIIKKSSAALAVAATMTMGLTACGKDAPPAKDAWNKAQDKLGTYKSMAVSADGTDDKNKKTAMTINGTVDGKSTDMTMKGDTGSAEIRVIGDKTYMKGDKGFWSSTSGGTDATAEKMVDKWVEMPSSQSKTTDSPFKEMIKEFQDDNSDFNKKMLSDKATVESDSVNGKGAWKITSEDKKSIAWVSDDDKFDLLKIQGDNVSKSTSGSSGKLSQVTINNHDQEVKVEKPADAKSLTDLMLGG